MGVKNFLIDGGSGTGKTTVCKELVRRGYQALNGDREFAYRGYPETGEPLNETDLERAMNDLEWGPKVWIWDVDKVKSAIADHSESVTFFCGGSRNFSKFIDLLDGVFVLEVEELDTIMQRIDQRVLVDPTDWGAKPEEKESVRRLHRSKEGIAPGHIIDASQPLDRVVDEILHYANLPIA